MQLDCESAMAHGIPTESTATGRRGLSAPVVVTVLLVVYWAALFYGTHTRLPPGLLPGNSDKVVHFGSYAGLGMLLMSLRAIRGPYPWSSVIGRWVVLACYGAFDEITQMLVNRTADVADWFADITGAAFGLGLVTGFLWFYRSPKKTDARV